MNLISVDVVKWQKRGLEGEDQEWYEMIWYELYLYCTCHHVGWVHGWSPSCHSSAAFDVRWSQPCGCGKWRMRLKNICSRHLVWAFQRLSPPQVNPLSPLLRIRVRIRIRVKTIIGGWLKLRGRERDGDKEWEIKMKERKKERKKERTRIKQ